MSEFRELVVNAAKAILNKHCTSYVLNQAESGLYPQALWDALEEGGVPWALVPESDGGAGLTIMDAGALIRECAYFSAPVPVCETILATWLLTRANLAIPAGAISVRFIGLDDAPSADKTPEGWRIRGTIQAVPWASQVSSVVLVLNQGGNTMIAVVPRDHYKTKPGINLAAEPRESIELDRVLAPEKIAQLPHADFNIAHELGAALRTAQISGALQRTLELSVAYTMERKQFGRPLAKFQAVQNNLAILAGQTAAANGAAELALGAATKPNGNVAVGAAKARASEAATLGAALAHQVHGAMGLTNEYALHHYTQRLLSWRDEFGSEWYWWSQLGETMLQKGAERYWAVVCEVDEIVAAST